MFCDLKLTGENFRRDLITNRGVNRGLSHINPCLVDGFCYRVYWSPTGPRRCLFW
jgi:hypothetical protein